MYSLEDIRRIRELEIYLPFSCEDHNPGPFNLARLFREESTPYNPFIEGEENTGHTEIDLDTQKITLVDKFGNSKTI